jgi:hypothetical protein
MAVLVVGLATLGTRYGASGVALAVDIMLVVGIGLLVTAARPWADFSPRRLFLAPGLALLAGMVAALAVLAWAELANPWWSACVKSSIFGGVYVAVLLAAERAQLRQMVQFVWRQMQGAIP